MGYTWMVDPGIAVSQDFGTNPNNGYNPWGGHTGQDRKANIGTPVYAAAAGTVVAAGLLGTWDTNYLWINGPWAGNVVYIDHGPVILGAAHLSEIYVTVGQQVSAGDLVGRTGDTGAASTGPHCHLEALPDGWNFQNGTYGRVHPALYCSDTPVTPASTPQPTEEKDWFDMATQDDLVAAVKTVLSDPAVLDSIALAVLHRPCDLVDPSGHSKDVTGTTTLAKKINWAAYNNARLLDWVTPAQAPATPAAPTPAPVPAEPVAAPAVVPTQTANVNP